MLPKLQQQKNAVVEVSPNPLAEEFPVINAEQLIIANIHLAMPPKQQHHVPAAHLTPDKAANAAKTPTTSLETERFFFSLQFKNIIRHNIQFYRLSLKYSLAFLYFPV